MKRIPVFLLLCLSLILLCGCVFPPQHISPDPEPASSSSESGAVFNSSDFAIPFPTADESPDSAAAEAVQQQDPQSEAVAIDNPKLAVFWYAMADAQVFSFREQFGPVLEASGLPFREFDAENDRYHQLDQIRDAVSGGWNLLAVQLVDDRSTEEAEEILELASGCPVIFFDRMPDSTLFADMLPEEVAWRQKEQFSDGVGYSWIDTLKRITSEAVSDEQMAHAAECFPINPPKNKEEYYYRSIFAEHFPSDSAAKSVPSEVSVACSTAIALEWDASFSGLNDPSGRAVKGVHEQAY